MSYHRDSNLCIHVVFPGKGTGSSVLVVNQESFPKGSASPYTIGANPLCTVDLVYSAILCLVEQYAARLRLPEVPFTLSVCLTVPLPQAHGTYAAFRKSTTLWDSFDAVDLNGDTIKQKTSGGSHRVFMIYEADPTPSEESALQEPSAQGPELGRSKLSRTAGAPKAAKTARLRVSVVSVAFITPLGALFKTVKLPATVMLSVELAVTTYTGGVMGPTFDLAAVTEGVGLQKFQDLNRLVHEHSSLLDVSFAGTVLRPQTNSAFYQGSKSRVESVAQLVFFNGGRLADSSQLFVAQVSVAASTLPTEGLGDIDIIFLGDVGLGGSPRTLLTIETEAPRSSAKSGRRKTNDKTVLLSTRLVRAEEKAALLLRASSLALNFSNAKDLVRGDNLTLLRDFFAAQIVAGETSYMYDESDDRYSLPDPSAPDVKLFPDWTSGPTYAMLHPQFHKVVWPMPLAVASAGTAGSSAPSAVMPPPPVAQPSKDPPGAHVPPPPAPIHAYRDILWSSRTTAGVDADSIIISAAGMEMLSTVLGRARSDPLLEAEFLFQDLPADGPIVCRAVAKSGTTRIRVPSSRTVNELIAGDFFAVPLDIQIASR